MTPVITRTKRTFAGLLVVSILLTVTAMLVAMAVVSTANISRTSTISDLHSLSKKDDALATYISSQKGLEAHFNTLIDNTRQQDRDHITRALAATGIITVAVSFVVALLLSKVLIKPVAEAYASQERFLQDAAHELRNPLTALSIALQHSESQKLPPGQLNKIFRRQTKRLVSINEDLLFLEKTRSPALESTNVSELLLDVVEELSPLAGNHNIALNIQTQKGLTVRIASKDYVHIVKNVIENAIKYSHPNSRVAISLQADKKYIITTVSDTGIGMSPHDVALAGTRFFRAQNVGRIDGTGLGLAIVKKVLRTYGGKLDITSVLDSGTTVTVSIKRT